jgi:PRC-barrel domain
MANVMHLAVLALAMTVSPATAQDSASPGAQLVGLPVFAGDGQKVGQVADVSMSDGRIDLIRILAGSSLGFGARLVAIPKSAFMLKGTSVLIPDLRSEDIEALPTAASENHGARTRKR